jgi:hypothetical protein
MALRRCYDTLTAGTAKDLKIRTWQKLAKEWRIETFVHIMNTNGSRYSRLMRLPGMDL